MRPKHKLQSPKKPVYFLASVALHLVLVGLLIYFYSNFFYSPPRKQTKAGEEKTAVPPASALDKGIALTEEDSAWNTARTPPPPPTSTGFEKEKTIETGDDPEKEALSEAPLRALPLSENNSATSSGLDSEQDLHTQELNSSAETEHFNENIKHEPRKETPHPSLTPPPAPESRAQAQTLPPREPDSPPVQPHTGVIRAQFTTGVEQHEPLDQVGPVIAAKKDGVKRLYYFTEVKGMKGKTIIHRWEYEGRLLAEVQLPIDSHQWRTYSSKDLLPTMAGHWQVVVTDEKGRLLHTDSFMYK